MPQFVRSKYWKQAQVSRSGRPILERSEAEILIQDNIGLYQDNVKLVDNQNGRVYMTDQRLIFISKDSASSALNGLTNSESSLNLRNKSGQGKEPKTNTDSICLSLLDIESIELYNGFLKSSPKITLYMKSKSEKENTDVNDYTKSQDVIMNSTSLRKDSFVTSLYSKPPTIQHDLNWICPICYFSNILPTDQINKITKDNDQTLPKCETCGVKASRELIDNLLDAETAFLDNLNPNVVSKDGFHCPKCTFINHPSLTYCEMCGTRLLSSNLPPSILQASISSKVTSDSDGDDPDDLKSISLKEIEFLSEDYSLDDDLDPKIIKLSFRKGGAKAFYDKLFTAIETSKWNKARSSNSVNKGAVRLSRDEIGSSMNSKDLVNKVGNQIKQEQTKKAQLEMAPIMGIHGLETSSTIKSQEDYQLLNNSVQDLENLMDKAKELIVLSQSYQKVLVNNDNQNANSTIKNNLDILQNSKYSIKILDNIITKNDFMKSYSNSKNSKALFKLKYNSDENGGFQNSKTGLPILYIEELSRQIYEFINDENLLDKNNGLITMYELFIMYNRARGINLISPSELYDAVVMFGELKLNMKLIKIDLPYSKKDKSIEKKEKDKDMFYIISKGSVSSNSVSTRIVKHLKDISTISKPKGQSILDLQHHPRFKMNYLILTTLLTNLVNDGSVCVDQTIGGEVYYTDHITEFDWDKDYFDAPDEFQEDQDVDMRNDALEGIMIPETLLETPQRLDATRASEGKVETSLEETSISQNSTSSEQMYVSDTLRELQGLDFN